MQTQQSKTVDKYIEMFGNSFHNLLKVKDQNEWIAQCWEDGMNIMHAKGVTPIEALHNLDLKWLAATQR